MDVFLDEHKKFLLLLLKHNVEFMLIGGYAVILYGYERGTSDMDLWLKPSNKNRDKFIEALLEHGILKHTVSALNKMDFTETLVMHIGENPNRIDFLTKVQGVKYEEADSRKTLLPLQNKYIPVIHYHHLITSKMITGRLQDKIDVEQLKKINKKKNKK